MAKNSLKSYFERLPYEKLERVHSLYRFMESRYKGDSSRLEALGDALCGDFSDLRSIVTGKGSTVNAVRSGERAYQGIRKQKERESFDLATAEDERIQNLRNSEIPEDLWPYVSVA